MSETVKRYPKRLTRTQIELAQPRREFVLATDYDALAAELATVKKVAYGNLELMEDRDAALAECERLRDLLSRIAPHFSAPCGLGGLHAEIDAALSAKP